MLQVRRGYGCPESPKLFLIRTLSRLPDDMTVQGVSDPLFITALKREWEREKALQEAHNYSEQAGSRARGLLCQRHVWGGSDLSIAWVSAIHGLAHYARQSSDVYCGLVPSCRGNRRCESARAK